MAHLDIGAVPFQLAGDVHQATEIAGENGRGTGRRDIGAFIANHLVGNIGILHTKGAPKPATGLPEGKFAELHPADGLEQLSRLGPHAHFPQAGAGIVIGDGPAERCVDRIYAAHIRQERHQLIGSSREVARPGRHRLIALKKLGIVFGQHAGAGA